MIAVDTSAVLAILQDEEGAARLHGRLASADGAVMSAGNVLELQLVIARTGKSDAWDDVAALLDAYRIRTRAFDEAQLDIARGAAMRFGRGRHKARLNYGDCFAYALARLDGIPLLCVGNDFAHTDVELA